MCGIQTKLIKNFYLKKKSFVYLAKFGEKKITDGPVTIITIINAVIVIHKNLYFSKKPHFSRGLNNKCKRDVTYINLSITQKTVTQAASTRNADDKRKILHVNQCILTILSDNHRLVVE
jgi:hypothetical protein